MDAACRWLGVNKIDQRGWINETEFNGWTILFTQFHKGEWGSRFQNGGKWTCGVRFCCDMWLFNERMSTHFRKKEIRGKNDIPLVLQWGTGRDLLVDTGNLLWVTRRESTTLNESWPSPTCSPVNPFDHFRWKELFTRLTLVDSTVLINLGDPCKRAFSRQVEKHKYGLTPYFF